MPSSTVNAISKKESDEIDIGRLIGELIDHRKLIISITLLTTVFALTYALFSTPIYQANALIQVEQKQGNAILDSLSQVLPNTTPQSAPEIALLQSRMILGKTADDLNLQVVVEPQYFPIFGKGFSRLSGESIGDVKISRLYFNDKLRNNEVPIVLQVLDKEHYTLDIDGRVLKGKVGELLGENDFSIKVDSINAKPNSKFNIHLRTKLKAISELADSFSVSDLGKDTGMLTLIYSGSNPNRNTEILNSISQNYLSQNIARQAAQNAKSLEFLQEQLPKVRNDLDQAEDKLNTFRRQNDSVDLSLEAKSVLDQIVNVDNQLNELTFREAEISQLFTKEHPSYKSLLEKRKTLQQEKEKLNKSVSKMPKTQQEILRLSRDVESGQAVYMQLLNRQQELNIAKSSAIGNVRIIDDAVTDPIPIKPQKILIIIIGIMFGFIISVCVVLFRVMLRRGIESPEQLEELGINVYASVPVSEWSISKNSKREGKRGFKKGSPKNTNLLVFENPADLAIEAIRGLRTSLHFAMMEAKNNVLMISGASPNAGKTFISTNLAEVIAQSKQRVLFIDSDMRKGYVHKMFGLNNENHPGLSDYLSGKTSIDSIINRFEEYNFDCIVRGVVPPNPAELLMHTRMAELLEWASSNYDLVIVDTPPILAVTDAAIIGRYAGTTLLVARYEVNTAKEIDVSIRRFEQSGVIIKGCILNGIVKKASSYYSYGYNYYDYTYVDKK
jgi:tyrosine-protein kinase Etk/Wzc